MEDCCVLVVGLTPEQVAGVMPSGATLVEYAATEESALRLLATLAPALILAGSRVGCTDTLELFARAFEASAERTAPVLFLGGAAGDLQPMLYLRRRSGLEARFLDAQGVVHTHFIEEPRTEEAFSVRALSAAGLAAEIERLLAPHAAGAPETQADREQQLWEIGYNQQLAHGESEYHVQTEVVATQPVTAATSVFAAGRMLHSEQHTLAFGSAPISEVRRAVEALHAAVVGRISRGELR